jgi:two-component system, OmpR family, sensor kinase
VGRVTTTVAATQAVETTTDQRRHVNARPDRSGVSVRTRITATVALMVTLALTGAGAIVYLIESQRIDQQIDERIDQAFSGLAQFQADADTGGQLGTLEELLRGFLSSQVPAENETLVGWYDGAVQLTSAKSHIDVKTQAFAEAAASIATTNGTTTIVQDDDTLIMDAQTVQVTPDDVGALIVVTYATETRQGLHDTIRTYAIVALLSLVIITALAWAQAGRLLAPLRTLRETADEVTDSDLSNRLPVTGNDDITALTRTVNRMLDRLESAFVGQRQFLDDAGHELKTPLTVLRGHLELLDIGSPQEIAETRELLLDEVDRMSRLVGDLILLAKSDRPDFVSHRQVDLTGLTIDVLAKARGLGDRRWTLDETASVIASVDEQRLTQALLQLCDNAVKHTGPGDEIALGSSYDGATARLWVRDSGPGVPPADRDQIFERFGRSEVLDHDEGFGLGLSIVRAIALAHDGSVTVADAHPHGAVFTLVIPTGVEPLTDEDDDEVVELDHQVEDQTEELPIWHGS